MCVLSLSYRLPLYRKIFPSLPAAGTYFSSQQFQNTLLIRRTPTPDQTGFLLSGLYFRAGPYAGGGVRYVFRWTLAVNLLSSCGI